MDSNLNCIEIGADDPEDAPDDDVLCEMFSSIDCSLRSGCMSFNVWPLSGEGVAGANSTAEVDHIVHATCDDEMVAWDDMKQYELNPAEVAKARAVEALQQPFALRRLLLSNGAAALRSRQLGLC